jgi:hypothetical protein
LVSRSRKKRRKSAVWMISGLLSLGLIGGHPRSAFADDTAAAGNQLLGVQIADAITTRSLLEYPGCYERDPLAKPFVHSDIAIGAMVVVTNVVARRLFRHAPGVLRILAGVDAVAVGNNVRVLSRR